jgi:6-pyruvoyltetrahydropterin/6-carboxytetrahydropterin synthase
MMPSIAVKHNIEVAHRLFELPGKCEQIHGHSMWVTMELHGDVNSKGILAGIEYGDLKKMFRQHLDETYDHRLLLNASDPFARPIFMVDEHVEGTFSPDAVPQVFLPGLQATVGDPTTENIAEWIATVMREEIVLAGWHENLIALDVTVWETSVNMAKSGTLGFRNYESWKRGTDR